MKQELAFSWGIHPCVKVNHNVLNVGMLAGGRGHLPPQGREVSAPCSLSPKHVSFTSPQAKVSGSYILGTQQHLDTTSTPASLTRPLIVHSEGRHLTPSRIPSGLTHTLWFALHFPVAHMNAYAPSRRFTDVCKKRKKREVGLCGTECWATHSEASIQHEHLLHFESNCC